MSKPRAPEQAAVRTLRHAGYTYHGGEMWKPPLGLSPHVVEAREKLRAMGVLDPETGLIHPVGNDPVPGCACANCR